MTTAIKIENVSKLYRLGTLGTGTFAHDLNRWWHLMRGKADPYAKVGQVNDRTQQTNDVQKGRSRPSTEHVWALRDINLDVPKGEILGIIGKNGAGKSTLLKLLSRVTSPTTGTIRCRGRIASLLEVGTGFHPELTGRENIYMNGSIMGMRRHEITKQLDEIVEFSGCAKYIDTPVKRYSSGMTVRLGFAVAAHLACEILIVDEVLAVGDWEFQNKCLAKMKDITSQHDRTVLFVTHNLASLRHLCSSAVIIDKGTLAHQGDPEEMIDIHLRSTSTQGKDMNISPLGGPLAAMISVDSVIINSQAVQKQQVELVDSSRLTIEVCVNSQVDGCFDFGLAISVQGVRIATQIAAAIAVSAGRNRVSFCFPDAFLNGGSFQIGVGVSDPVNRSSWAWGENLFELMILNNPPTAHPMARGLVNVVR